MEGYLAELNQILPENYENYEKACQAHPDKYQNISSATNEMGDEWNPRLHLILHSIVLDQKDASEPVEEAFKKLVAEPFRVPYLEV